ncbi:MAG: class I SAM-dependent methyltransferase [Chloroflexi bacterium]|nr:class I SAM-dependent methyltransferase [Chloroflexota bacterium]MCL5076352.1 class I SAM-dependent methyltransferase [Chloroflexota bacterium]
MSKFGGYEDLPFIAEYYDLIPSYVNRPDLDFYLGYSRSADGKILELGCGTGRILIPTAVAGCRIVGLDLSEHMLARCRQKLRGQPREVQERVRLIQGNMTSFDLKETFSLITTPLLNADYIFKHEYIMLFKK